MVEWSGGCSTQRELSPLLSPGGWLDPRDRQLRWFSSSFLGAPACPRPHSVAGYIKA